MCASFWDIIRHFSPSYDPSGLPEPWKMALFGPFLPEFGHFWRAKRAKSAVTGACWGGRGYGIKDSSVSPLGPGLVPPAGASEASSDRRSLNFSPREAILLFWWILAKCPLLKNCRPQNPRTPNIIVPLYDHYSHPVGLLWLELYGSASTLTLNFSPKIHQNGSFCPKMAMFSPKNGFCLFQKLSIVVGVILKQCLTTWLDLYGSASTLTLNFCQKSAKIHKNGPFWPKNG